MPALGHLGERRTFRKITVTYNLSKDAKGKLLGRF